MNIFKIVGDFFVLKLFKQYFVFNWTVLCFSVIL